MVMHWRSGCSDALSRAAWCHVSCVSRPQGAAKALALREWGPLYDAAALARNAVPVACTAYFEDL